jgi:hypothetical protein
VKWTSDTPTVEGWYFWRRSDKYDDSLHYRVEYIEPDMLGITPWMKKHGEWAGPIPEPE